MARNPRNPNHSVKVHDPLKQGLKLSVLRMIWVSIDSVEVHDPLKQGLKLIPPFSIHLELES